MPSAPQPRPSPHLHFWDWSKPILHHAVAELMQSWSGTQLDLTGTAILVPTAESARRLREALAVATAAREGAVMAPHIWSPEAVLARQFDGALLATHLQERLIWTAVLEGIAPSDYPALFPSPPAIERRAWASGVAETLSALRQSTGGGGLSLADVAQRLADGPDAPRWAELAQLERLFLAQLSQLGLQDIQEAKRAHAANPVLPQEVQRVLVFALADPPRLVRDWIQNAARSMPVEIFVHAPERERHRFDELGVPRVSAWTQQAPPLDLGEDRLHLVSQPEDQAVRAAALVRALAEQGSATAIGLCEPGLAPHVVGVLAGEGVRAYDPAGRSAAQHPLLELLRTWQQLAQSRTWRRLTAFLRQDDVLRAITKSSSSPSAPSNPSAQSDSSHSPAPLHLSATSLLSHLDAFHASRLPATLDDALSLSSQSSSIPSSSSSEVPAHFSSLLQDLSSRLSTWETSDAPGALRGLLDWIYGAREFRTESEQDRDYVQLLGEAMRLVEEAQSTANLLRADLTASEILHAALHKLESTSLADPRGDVDLVLHGWLELPWESAPGLVICGFNDESVPGAVTVDAFLPDHVREKLGLPCQATRAARDACLLTAMAAQRRAAGTLHLVLGHMSDSGDVLRPSRLLFACSDSALPARVRHLFPESSGTPAQTEPARSIAWKLRPWRVPRELRDITPSLLSSYLRCPLRCYLQDRRFLNMGAVDPAQREMSPMDFGSLVHEVLASFGNNAGLRDAFAEQKIAEFFDDTLSTLAREKWGAKPLLSTVLQIETARQRLRHAARVQALLREEGWRIHDVELDLNQDGLLTLAGLPFRARADRVDINAHTGAVRVWDYKTRHKPKPPAESHIATARLEDMENPDLAWKCFLDGKGKAQQWTDLQLPLYVWALKRLYPDVPTVEAAYFHLPAAVSETAAAPWTGLDESLVTHALTCAETAATRMKDGIFWPPTADLRTDDFEELLLSDPLATVEDTTHWKASDQ